MDIMAQQQISDAERLAQAATLAVDDWCTDHRDQLEAIAYSPRIGLIVEAVVAVLIGQGWVASGPLPEWLPADWREAIPEHLRPDVDEAYARQMRINDAVTR